MIITRTPFRMSFFGGGADLPEFFDTYGGAVLSTTFDKYCYVNVRELPPFFDYRSEIVYSRIERVQESAEITHPLVRNAMAFAGLKDLRISYEADLPARSGLGTSSSFAVGLLHAFHAMKGEPCGPRVLAQEAIYLERTLCAEVGGWQDQVAAACGGLNRIDFRDGDFTVKPLEIGEQRRNDLNAHLQMYFTGFTRLSSDMQKQSKSMEEKTAQLREMLSLVDEAEKILTGSGSLDEFGRLLDLTWRLKRQTGDRISTGSIDEWYRKGVGAGALGGKLLGAGGGGFLVFYVPDGAQEAVRRAMDGLLYIPFRFENTGSVLMYSDADGGSGAPAGK